MGNGNYDDMMGLYWDHTGIVVLMVASINLRYSEFQMNWVMVVACHGPLQQHWKVAIAQSWCPVSKKSKYLASNLIHTISILRMYRYIQNIHAYIHIHNIRVYIYIYIYIHIHDVYTCEPFCVLQAAACHMSVLRLHSIIASGHSSFCRWYQKDQCS